MKTTNFWILAALFGLLLSCQKDNDIFPYTGDPEALSESDLAVLDNMPEATGFSPATVVLPNGETLENYLKAVDAAFYDQWFKTTATPFDDLGPQGARNLLISRLSAVAFDLTDRSQYQKPDEGPGRPAQNGLAYSWGGKNHNIRQTPPGAGTACTEQLYGLDCSGFIHQLFTNAGVPIVAGPANVQRKANELKNAIKAGIPVMDKVKVEELEDLPVENFETGDIIYWKNPDGGVRHIGLVLKALNGDLAVFQSNGSPGNGEQECLKNRGLSRGSRRLELTEAFWFGPAVEYGITRINAEISGDWELFLKCDDEPNDIATIALKFPPGKNSSFTIKKDWTDYDGDKLKTKFEFSYDNTLNVLFCNFTTTAEDNSDFIREDSFSVKLEKDETEYIPCTNLEMRPPDFCNFEVRLRNKG